MNSIIKESFSINITVMRIVGLYPSKKNKCIYKTGAYIMYFIFIVLGSALVLLNILQQENRNILELNFSGAYLAETICFITKLLPFLKNGERIKRCIHYFGNSYFTPKNEEEVKIIKECNRICRRNSMVYFIGVTVAEIMWNIKTLFMGNNQMPIDVWLPFEINAGTSIYWATYFALTITSMYAGYAGTMIDPLIGGLACQTAGQLKILKYKVQHLQEQIDMELSADKTNTINDRLRLMHEKIKECIKHHILILCFVNEYEKCFSLVVFSQFASSAFGICFCCLQLSAVPLTSFAGISAFCYVGVMIGQIYFYCYYGTELFEENESLRDAVYMGRWYEYDTVSKRALLILMERSKRPMIVTAGKIVNLTVETFTTILKRSYSLIAVLKTYQ